MSHRQAQREEWTMRLFFTRVGKDWRAECGRRWQALSQHRLEGDLGRGRGGGGEYAGAPTRREYADR